MAKATSTLLGVPRDFETWENETLATWNGLTLERIGGTPICGVFGNGTATAATTVAVPKFCAPNNASAPTNPAYASQCGCLDAWTADAGIALSAYKSTAGTGAGNARTWDIATLANCRPFLLYMFGDQTTFSTYTSKILGVSHDFIPAAETQAASVYRYAYRNFATAASGVAGTCAYSIWGNICILNLNGISKAELHR